MDQIGEHTITIIATDSFGDYGEASFNLQIEGADGPQVKNNEFIYTFYEDD